MSTNPGTNTMGISATYYPNQQPGGVLTHSRADRLGATKIPQVSEAHHSKRSHSVRGTREVVGKSRARCYGASA